MGGDAGQMDPPGLQFDEEQHIQPSQPDRVDGEEVARHDPGSLLAQERPPGRGRSPWGGVEAVAAQGGADHRRRDAHAKVEQFALDALVAPARVLPGQADDQLLHLLVQWRPAGLAIRVGPGAGYQPPVPAQQRLGLDQEARPAGAGQHAADCGEQRPVGGFEPGPRDLAAQDGELVAQDQDLQILGGVTASEQHQQLDGPAQRQVGEVREHQGGGLPIRAAGASPYRAMDANTQLTGHVRLCAPFR